VRLSGRLKVGAIGVLASVAAMSGCGGSSKSSTAAGPLPASSATPTTVTATKGGSFCAILAASINSAASLQFTPGATPSQVKADLQRSLQEEQRALSTAPSSIKPDMRTVVSATNQLYSAFEAIGFDPTKATPTTFTAFSTAQFQNAARAVAVYIKGKCGISAGPSSPSTTV
jgi:hypothetical protein